MNPLLTIPCTNPHCHRPVATIVNGSLVITTRHGGEKHQGIISLAQLRDLLEKDSLTNSVQPVLCSAPVSK